MAAGKTWEAGVQYAFTAVLLSPKFLFRLELDEKSSPKDVHPLNVSSAAEQGVDHGQRRQLYRSSAQRAKRQQCHQRGKPCGCDHQAFARTLCHHVALNPAYTAGPVVPKLKTS